MLRLLAEGDLDVQGRITGASNATLYVTATLDGVTAGCVYKPISGEKPLWDFPSGTLGLRETASYVLSAWTGLDVVPPTVLREGPFGPGSVQLWVNPPTQDVGADVGQDDGADSGADSGADVGGAGRGAGDGNRGASGDRPRETGLGGFPLTVEPVPGEPGAGVVDVLHPRAMPKSWLQVLMAEDGAGNPVVLAHADDPGLRRIALFDAVANNTDRKGGHILRAVDGRIFGVDHGLTFHLDDKLRTVLWGWAGDPLDDEAREVLERLVVDLRDGDRDGAGSRGSDGGGGPSGAGGLRVALDGLLEPAEIDRTAQRARRLLRRGRYPKPPGDWHAIPWPPF